jgi:hypothetical protein
VAKTRRPLAAKKKSPAKAGRSKPVKKAAKAPKKTVKRAKAAKVKVVKKVELKELRKQFASVLAALSLRRSATLEGSAKLDDTRRRISQWMTDIDDICSPEDQEICGPDMAFPLP